MKLILRQLSEKTNSWRATVHKDSMKTLCKGANPDIIPFLEDMSKTWHVEIPCEVFYEDNGIFALDAIETAKSMKEAWTSKEHSK